MAEKENGDVIQIPVGKYTKIIRQNPWMISTFALGFLLLLSLAFGVFGAGSGVVISEEEVSQKTVDFLSQRVSGEIKVDSIAKENGFYKLNLIYDGEDVPVYVTLDGKNLISDFVPLDGSLDSGETPGESLKVESINFENAPVKGNANAPITIVEFSDYECPFCGQFFLNTLPSIEENYIKTGKAKLVYMDFPLNFHPQAQIAAEAVRCVREQGGDEAYWKMHDKIFANQASLNEMNLKKWALELGYNIDACLASGKYADKVQADLTYGSSLGVTGTPGFFVGNEEKGYIEISGAQPYSVFEQIIESQLEA